MTNGSISMLNGSFLGLKQNLDDGQWTMKKPNEINIFATSHETYKT